MDQHCYQLNRVDKNGGGAYASLGWQLEGYIACHEALRVLEHHGFRTIIKRVYELASVYKIGSPAA